MSEFPSQVPPEADKFVSQLTDETDKEGFIDPEIEAHHQAIKEEIGHLKHESRIESRKLWELIRPLEEEIKKNEKLELDFGDRIYRSKGDKGTEDYYQEEIKKLQSQNRQLRAEIDKLNLDPTYQVKKSTEEEMRTQSVLAEDGETDEFGHSVKKS